jgi:hypothetical protein
MEHLASAREHSASFEAPEATEDSQVVGEGIGLGALLVVLMPVALAAWFAIGLMAYRVLT